MRFAFALIIAVLGLSAQAQKSDRSVEKELSPTGMELFQAILSHEGISSRPTSEHEPKIVIILGNLDPFHDKSALDAMISAYHSGGAILLAPTTNMTLDFGEIPICFHKETVSCHQRSSLYQGFLKCPFVVPITNSRKRPGENPERNRLFAGLNRVATNISGSVSITKAVEGLRPIAKFPDNCFAEGSPLPKDHYFAVSGVFRSRREDPRSGSSKILFLGDPSVFSNQMLTATGDDGTDNFLFAINVARWLRTARDDDQARTHCELYIDGRRIDRIDDVRSLLKPVPPSLPIPNPLDPKIQAKGTEMIDSLVDRFQSQDRLNRALFGSTDEGRPIPFRNLAVLLALAGIVFVARKIFKSGHSADIPPPPVRGRFDDAAEGDPIAGRLLEFHRRNDYASSVRIYIRNLFTARGLVVDPENPPVEPPGLEVTGSNARAVHEAIRILWDVAYSPCDWSLPYSRWKELEPVLKTVRRAAEADRWRFTNGDRE